MRSRFVLALAGWVLLVSGHPGMAQDSVMADETPAAADDAASSQGELPIVEENGLVGLATPRKEPDFFVVEGVAYNDLLNVREKASAGGRVRGRLPNGVPLRNLGCGEFNGAKWCQVETLDEPKIVGWAAGRYMHESYVENAFGELPTEARIETPADWEEQPPAIPAVTPTADAAPAETASTVQRGAKAPALAQTPVDRGGESPTAPGVAPAGSDAAPAVATSTIEQSVGSPTIGAAPEARDAAPPIEKMASLPTGSGLSSAEAASATEPTAEPPETDGRRPVPMTPLARNIAGWLAGRGMRIEGVSPLPTTVAGRPTADSVPAEPELPVGQGSGEPPAATGSVPADAASPTVTIAALPGGESAPAAPGFNATGEIPCARYYGQPMSRCVARVKRVRDGSAIVIVAWPDGGQRTILFTNGRADNSDSPDLLTYTREADLNMIRVGKAERFEIPDALPFGG